VLCARPVKPFERGRPVCGGRGVYANSIVGKTGVTVRRSASFHREGENVVETPVALRKDDLVLWEGEICWMGRHKRTVPAETGNGFVALVVSSCGDSISSWWRTQLDFISRNPFDDPPWSAAFWASSKRTRVIHGGGLLLSWRCRAEKLEAKRQGSGTAPAGEKAEVTDAHETFGKHLRQEAV
jgi:hypothetical protein